MATRAKDANVKKDKKPLASSLAQRQWKPKPLASQLGSDDKVKSSSSSSSATNPARKPAPNYLRPTLSSKPETLTRTTKKSATTSSANNEDKARLVRRRSLDRPPSLSRQDSAASRLRTSSSLKSTGISSNRTASSMHKPGGSRLMYTALKSQLPLRRSSSSSAPVSSTTSPTKVDEAGLGSDPDNKLEETIEVGLVCSDAEAEQVHPDELETEQVHLDELETSEDQNPPQEVLIEETEDELLDGTEEEELENLNHGDEKSQAEDSSPDEARVSDQDKGEENVVEGQELAASKQLAAEEVKQEEEEEEGEVARDEATRGDHVEEAEVQEQHEETPAGSVQKRVVVQGKKESPSAYNDVIEETKNKLLETRKNKVKALVGAFETVIDYESGSK